MPYDDKWRCMLLTIISLILAIYVPPLHATHENDHRFTIFGTLRDGTTFPGVPLPNKEIVVQDTTTKQIMQRGVTDGEGKFMLVLHVHNGDVGKVVWIQSAGIAKQLTLQFDPSDVTTERRAQVDLIVFPPSIPPPTSPPQ
jgi:hypothetical protein